MGAWKKSLSTSVLMFGIFAACVVPSLSKATDAVATPKARLRNIVRNKLPAGASVVGLEFKILKVNDAGGQAAVDPEEHSFKVGDSFLVKIKPQDDVYVYVFTEGPGSDAEPPRRTCLLPESPDTPLLVRADEEISLPENGDLFTFEPPAGEEKLVVVALKEPNSDLNLIASQAFSESTKRLRSDAEKQEQSKAVAAIEGLRERAVKGVRTRGAASSKKMVDAIEGAMAKAGSDAGRAQLEASDAESGGTEVVAINTPELIIDIPLRSRSADRAGVSPTNP